MKKIAIGSDPNAAELKHIIKQYIEEQGYGGDDFGSDDPIYANVAFEVAERSVLSNNCNILTLGSQVTGSELAKQLVRIWLEAEYQPGGRSEPKIQRIYKYAGDDK